MDWRLGAQYGWIAEAVPGLLRDAIRYAHTARGSEQQAATRILAAAARAADAIAFKYGAHDLSARLIDLMRWAADRTGDPLVQAATAYVRTEVFLAARAHAVGLAELEQAIDDAPHRCPTRRQRPVVHSTCVPPSSPDDVRTRTPQTST